jgi:hypothetical protein
MKALPMLDHVALWYARFFTGSLFLLGLFWYYPIGKVSNVPLAVFCNLILYFLSFLGLWILHKQLARIYEVVFSVIWMGMLLHFVIMEWLDVVAHLMPYMIGLIGFGSIFRAALRTRCVATHFIPSQSC